MQKSLFHRDALKEAPPTPFELIEPEIIHLKKGYSIRHGEKKPRSAPVWILAIGFLWIVWLYVMDPVIHAWYKGEAAKTYVYLHNYGAGHELEKLVATRILNADEIHTLDNKHGSFQDTYSSPQAAAAMAMTITAYMNGVEQLHNRQYQNLDPIGRMRYLLFIRTGLYMPKAWDFMDPAVE